MKPYLNLYTYCVYLLFVAFVGMPCLKAQDSLFILMNQGDKSHAYLQLKRVGERMDIPTKISPGMNKEVLSAMREHMPLDEREWLKVAMIVHSQRYQNLQVVPVIRPWVPLRWLLPRKYYFASYQLSNNRLSNNF